MDSAQIGLLSRVAELARRNGLRPSDLCATLESISHEDGGGHEVLKFENYPTDPEKFERHIKVLSMLGLGQGEYILKTEFIDAMEDIVERAISLSPRLRSL